MNTADSLHFRIEKGELELPAWIKAVQRELAKMAPLDVARRAVSPGFWVNLAKAGTDLVGKLVDVSLADLLVGAWKTHRKFSKYKKGKLPADQVSVLPLSTHHIEASRKPYLELFLDGRPAGKILFELKLDVVVEAGVVVIQDGLIKRLEAGKAKVVGTLKCSGEVVAERASREFEWKEGVSFGEGIEISD